MFLNWDIVDMEFMNQEDGLLFLPVVLEAKDGFAGIDDLLNLSCDAKNISACITVIHFLKIKIHQVNYETQNEDHRVCRKKSIPLQFITVPENAWNHVNHFGEAGVLFYILVEFKT